MILAKIESGVIANLVDHPEALTGYVTAYDHNYIGQTVTSAGLPISTAAPSEHHAFDNTAGVDAWAVEDFSGAKNAKKATLSVACSDAITLGMVSSTALGIAHTYDCRRDDQTNASAAYFEANADSVSKDIMCSNGTTYDFRAHTASQCLQVVKALAAHVRLKRDRLRVTVGQVDAIDPLDTVTYPTHMDVINAIEAVTF